MNQEYVLLELSEFKTSKHKSLVGQKFTMQDKLTVGKDVKLIFNKTTIKSKFDSIVKTDDANKIFILVTNSFVASIQLYEYYNKDNE